MVEVMDLNDFKDCLAKETRSEHCKVYVEPSLKQFIEDYAREEGMSFSEAGRDFWLIATKVVSIINPHLIENVLKRKGKEV